MDAFHVVHSAINQTHLIYKARGNTHKYLRRAAGGAGEGAAPAATAGKSPVICLSICCACLDTLYKENGLLMGVYCLDRMQEV